MTQVTKIQATNLLALLERGVHPKLSGLTSEAEIPLYHGLRALLIGIINEPEPPPSAAPQETPHAAKA